MLSEQATVALIYTPTNENYKQNFISVKFFQKLHPTKIQKLSPVSHVLLNTANQ